MVLLDSYGAVVLSESTALAVAMVRGAASNATVANAIAAFSDGVATFDMLLVTDKPGVTVELELVAYLSDLPGGQGLVRASVLLAQCGVGEVLTGAVCTPCSARQYWTSTGANGDGACAAWPAGVDAESAVAGVPLDALPLAGGWWRGAADSTRVRRCATKEYCVGGNASEHSGYCASHRVGPLCAGGCAAPYELDVNSGDCVRCSTAERASARAMFYGLLAVVTAVTGGFAAVWFGACPGASSLEQLVARFEQPKDKVEQRRTMTRLKMVVAMVSD